MMKYILIGKSTLMNSKIVDPKDDETSAFHLIETMTGKTVARAIDPAIFRNVISRSESRDYTIHNEIEGWFEPATAIFKHSEQHQ